MIQFMKGKASRRIQGVEGEMDQTASNIQARSYVASNLEKYVKEF